MDISLVCTSVVPNRSVCFWTGSGFVFGLDLLHLVALRADFFLALALVLAQCWWSVLAAVWCALGAWACEGCAASHGS